MGLRGGGWAGLKGWWRRSRSCRQAWQEPLNIQPHCTTAELVGLYWKVQCTYRSLETKFQIYLEKNKKTLKEARMAAKLLKKRFNIQNVNDWLAENDKNMDGKLKIIVILSLFLKKTQIYFPFLVLQI